MRLEQFSSPGSDCVQRYWQQIKDRLHGWKASYRWPEKASHHESLQKRRVLENRVESERIARGLLTKATFDAIMIWGYRRPLPIDAALIEHTTQRSFSLLNCGRIADAAYVLMDLKGVGISGATKVLSLADPASIAIYDSRAAHGFSDLTCDGKRCLPIPQGRKVKGDSLPGEDWPTAFRRYVYLLRHFCELARAEPKLAESFKRAADFDLAFFARSKSGDGSDLASFDRNGAGTTPVAPVWQSCSHASNPR
jgi:hypothetical protein